MTKPLRLQRWDAAVAAYLSSRRAIGRRYDGDERILGNLRAYLARCGARDLDQVRFERWRRRWSHCITNTRVDYALVVYRFCRYRRRSEPRCFMPERLALGRHQAYPLPTPVDDQQVLRLLRFITQLRPVPGRPLRKASLRLAIVLLYTAGLRRGELARLTLEDADETTGVLRIRASKFHKSRWVPLSPSATDELRAYLRTRRLAEPNPSPGASLLCSRVGQPYSPEGLSNAVKNIMVQSGIWSGARRARVHDFRHGFAVAALRRWYETDADVQSHLPKLALYMGHVSIASTAYYLRLMPAVIILASQRFGRSCGDIIDGGAP